MLDYLRNLTKSAEEKQQEALNAYLDDALSPRERQQFEQTLTRDADLRQAVEQRRALQMQMRQMPRRRVPRNFTLDPAVYGRPQRQPLFQLYPVMRTAAVLTAFFFILAIGTELFLSGGGGLAQLSSAPDQDVAMMADEATEGVTGNTAVEAPFAAPAEMVEVPRILPETVVKEGETVEVTRTVTEAEVVEMEALEAAAEPMAEEEMVDPEEFAAEEAMPAAESSPLEAEDTSTADTAETLGGTDQNVAATMSLSTPSPAATQIADFDATKSTIPRPETVPAISERALTAVPTPQPELVAETVVIEPTAVPAPEPTREPIGGLRLLQIGLGVLLILLVTAVFYVRRQTF